MEITLGDEYDFGLRRTLLDALTSIGAVKVSGGEMLLGGSQEIERAVFSLRGTEIVVCAETYVGLSISGDEDLVISIRNMVLQDRDRDTHTETGTPTAEDRDTHK